MSLNYMNFYYKQLKAEQERDHEVLLSFHQVILNKTQGHSKLHKQFKPSVPVKGAGMLVTLLFVFYMLSISVVNSRQGTAET